MPWLKAPYQQLCKQINDSNSHAPILLLGMGGMGKSVLASSIIAYSLCLNKRNHYQACGQCRSCSYLAANTHPDVYSTSQIEAKQIGVDVVREIIAFAEQTTSMQATKFVFIAEMAKFTRSAQNALLKTLESPPGNQTQFILLSTSTTQVLATILSRTLSYKINVASKQQVIEFLQQFKFQADHIELAYFIASAAPLTALALLQDPKLLNVRIDFIQQVVALIEAKACPISLASQKTLRANEALYLVNKIVKYAFVATQQDAVAALIAPIRAKLNTQQAYFLGIIAEIHQSLAAQKQQISLNAQLLQEDIYLKLRFDNGRAKTR